MKSKWKRTEGLFLSYLVFYFSTLENKKRIALGLPFWKWSRKKNQGKVYQFHFLLSEVQDFVCLCVCLFRFFFHHSMAMYYAFLFLERCKRYNVPAPDARNPSYATVLMICSSITDNYDILFNNKEKVLNTLKLFI